MILLCVDAQGNHKLVSGPIIPIDVWSSNGVKYYVEFNELRQPLRKGGHILVRFLGYIAKQEHFCPLSDKTWHELDKLYKVDILNTIRVCFCISILLSMQNVEAVI